MSFNSGPFILGKRVFNASMISFVSSTLKVVCVTYASFDSSSTVRVSTSCLVCTNNTFLTRPDVPSTSGCPAWPIRMICLFSFSERIASLWTLVTSGQVASIVGSLRSFAWFSTFSDTPWALKMVIAPSGISSISFTKITPLFLRSFTT